MSDVPAIKADGLVKHYGKTKALDGLDLTVPDRHGLRPARPERGGEDHRRPHPGDAAAPGRRAGARPRPRRGRRRPRRAPDDRPHRPVRGARRVPHRAGQPDHDRPAQPADGAGRQGPGGRAARAVRPDRRRDPGGQDLLGRHAPAARPGGLADRPSGGAVPRRADDRPRPERPRADVGHRPAAGRGRHDAAAHHPVPRRGGRAGQPGRRHRRGQGHRRGPAGRAQGVRRRPAAADHAGRRVRRRGRREGARPVRDRAGHPDRSRPSHRGARHRLRRAGDRGGAGARRGRRQGQRDIRAQRLARRRVPDADRTRCGRQDGEDPAAEKEAVQ